ncbi:biopolymer transporter ExbD, partial [Methylacidiphilales bacterium]|nr:biopolymer transporter ExbD [Candidatus Methylacidiphilales bacterium]
MPSSSVKRQRRRKREDDGGEPEFQVAPMVDVLLVLLLFFMSITSTELLKKVQNLQLAEAKNAEIKDKQLKTNEIVINVGWNQKNSTAIFTMDGILYAAATDMQGILQGRIQQNPRAYVLIRADKDVEYSNIADLMTACAA